MILFKVLEKRSKTSITPYHRGGPDVAGARMSSATLTSGCQAKEYEFWARDLSGFSSHISPLPLSFSSRSLLWCLRKGDGGEGVFEVVIRRSGRLVGTLRCAVYFSQLPEKGSGKADH